jgi:hypothetical protein
MPRSPPHQERVAQSVTPTVSPVVGNVTLGLGRRYTPEPIAGWPEQG